MANFFQRVGKGGDSFEAFYIADLAYMPYGDLGADQITKRCEEMTEELVRRWNVDLVVVACNTATAYAIENLRKSFTLPFIGVEPYLNYINKVERSEIENHHVGALVTPATLKAPRFLELKKVKDPDGLIEVMAPEKLATKIEELIFHQDRERFKKDLQGIFKNYLPLTWEKMILGCTHYPLVKDELEEIIGALCISPTQSVVEQIMRVLKRSDIPDKKLRDIHFSYWNTQEKDWRKASLSEFLPWYLV